MKSWLSGATFLLWLIAVPSTVFTSANGVSITASHDFSPCLKPSTAKIEEGACEEEDSECYEYSNVGGYGNVTYYGQRTCSTSRDAYLHSTFGNSPVFMIETYTDENCNTLVKSEVYRADDQCHFFTYGLMKIWVSDDKTMAALLSSSYCESDDWNVVMDLNVSVNTGACIQRDSNGEKYILITDPTGTLPPLPTGTLPAIPTKTLPAMPTGSHRNNSRYYRDESLCTHQSEDDLNACRAFTFAEVEQSGILRLLDLGDELLRHDKWIDPLSKLHPSHAEGSLTLTEHLLQNLLPANRLLFGLWKNLCVEDDISSHNEGLTQCRCVHEQLIHGITTARGIQRFINQYELDLQWCELLLQREEILFQETGSVMYSLCGSSTGSSRIENQERRAYLDTILC